MEAVQGSEETDSRTIDNPQIKVEISSDSVHIKTEPLEVSIDVPMNDLREKESVETSISDTHDKTETNGFSCEVVHVKEEHGEVEDEDTKCEVPPPLAVKVEPVGSIEDSPNKSFRRSNRGKVEKKEVKQDTKQGVKSETANKPKKKYPSQLNRKPQNVKGMQFRQIIRLTDSERKIEHEESLDLRKGLPNVCEHCTLVFANGDIYKEHMRRHNKISGGLKCDVCPTRFGRSKPMKKHTEMHYKRYHCELCNEILRHSKTSTEHMEKAHAKDFILNVFLCRYCDERFWSPALLKKHLSDNHKIIKECPTCKKKFFDLKTFKAHVSSHSADPMKDLSLPCTVCSAVLPGHMELRRHEFQHEVESMCDLCGERCKTRENVAAHEKLKHTETVHHKSKAASCPECDRQFASRYAFKLHHRRIHEGNEKKYECDDCGRRYYTKGELREHVSWSHSGRGHACGEAACGRVFRTRARLQLHHERAHLHIKPTDLQLQCPDCDKTFAYSQLLKRHRERMHTDVRWPCPVCDTTFRTRSYVKTHVQLKHLHMSRADIRRLSRPLRHYYEPVEQEPEEYECEQCARKFATKYLLKRHFKRIHEDNPTFPCNECGATFKTQAYVAVHQKIKHQQNKPTHKQAKKRKQTVHDENFVDCGSSTINEGISVPLFDTFETVIKEKAEAEETVLG